jgi:transposase
MRVAPPITVKPEEREILERWARGRSTPVRQVQRAQIILLAAAGKQNAEIALEVGVTQNLVGRWRGRFAEQRIAGIEKDAPRTGRQPTRRQHFAKRIIDTTTQQKPAAATHWSTRTLAKVLGCSHVMVQRVWNAAGLKPHRYKTFKVSNDPKFAEKVVDVVGLYLNPPEHAVVICADEKSQIQALDRTQKSLPMYPGRCGTLTHDYKRNGTTSLFAAIDMLEGKIIAECMSRHRHQEWLKFLSRIDEQVPAELNIHLVCDNYGTHKHEKVKRWLKKHPRFQIHFIPTSSSWLNLIERWFREITEKRIRRGVFKSVPELIEAIMTYIDCHNADPKPFVWSAKSEDILEKVARARATLHNLQSK